MKTKIKRTFTRLFRPELEHGRSDQKQRGLSGARSQIREENSKRGRREEGARNDPCTPQL